LVHEVSRAEELAERRRAQSVGHAGPEVASERSSLEAGSTREKKREEEWRNVRNSVWQFGTGNRKCRWRARVYPEQGNEVILPLQPLELWAAGEEQLGGHAAGRLYPSRRCTFDEFELLADSIAASAPPPAHV
jgi:hypothetical protein